ncbi:MAG: protein translocase subunit SecD [Deltaproteobacteria bacterium]|nr:protein translocase subunit SecD [Deltaproteobacteria bacterium]
MKLTAHSTQIFVIIALILVCLVILTPTFLRSSFEGKSTLADYWVSRPVQLGLDLVGGVYVLFQIDETKFLEQSLDKKAHAISNLLRANEVPVLSSQRDNSMLTLKFVTERSLNRAEELLRSDADVSVKGKNVQNKELFVELRIQDFTKLVNEATSRAVEVIRSRIDQFGVAEPVVQRLGPNRVLVELPGVRELDRVKNIIGKTARLEFRFLPRSKSAQTEKLPMSKTGELVEVETDIVLTGDHIHKASVELTQSEGSVVAVQFDVEGAKEFAKITRENIGRNLAIILDGVIYSAPQIKTAITDGNAIITGLRHPQEARELAVVLRSGTLPAPFNSIEERLVGPTLGKVYIERAVLTLTFTLVAVLALMTWWYGILGIVASFVLIVNCLMIFSVLVLMQATLTFPGLAALALTIGVAVDSNIIIYERIKDAIKDGLRFQEAISRGFENAYSAIFDANITSLITSLIVYFLAHGPIKGFAITFAIGTITTLISAVFITKSIVFWLLENGYLREKGVAV